MNDKKVACQNEECSEYGIAVDIEPWIAAMCGPCGEWLRTPGQVATAMEHAPEYWDQYMGPGFGFPGT